MKHTGGHVRNAALSLDGNVVTIHVDLTGNIESAVLTIEGEFTPGVGDLTVDELGVGVDGRETTANTGSEGDIEDGTVGEGLGDQRLGDVDPAGGRAPENEFNVLTTIVDELASVVTILTDPGLAAGIARVGVGTSKNTENGKDVGNETTLLGNDSSTAEGQVGKEGEWDERKHV